MGRRTNLTEQQKDDIVRMREEDGLSHAVIAKHIGVSEGSVSWYCLMNGIERWGEPQPNNYAPPRGPVLRNGRPVRPFTEEDDRMLIGMEKTGAAYSDMARKLQRKPNSVRARLAILARKEERAAAVQEHAKNAKA